MTHAPFHIVIPAELYPCIAIVSDPLVGMDQHPIPWSTPPQCPKEGHDDQIGGDQATHSPTIDFTRKQVDHYDEAKPALRGGYIRNVGDLDSIGLRGRELLFELVWRNQRRLAESASDLR